MRLYLRSIFSEKKLSEIVLAKFFERIISRDIIRKSISSRRNFSSKALREIIYLPRELIVQGGYDLARFASTLKTEKTNKDPRIAEYIQTERRAL